MIEVDSVNCNIAVVASHGLGDGLILLVLAHNLQQQGHTVTFYNNFVAQLQSWIPTITVKPYPAKDEIEKTFAIYDLVISEVVSVITKDVAKEFYPELARCYVFIGLSQFDRQLIFDHAQKFLVSQDKSIKARQLANIAKCCGVIVPRLNKTQTMVSNIAALCEKVIGIRSATQHNGLIPWPNLTFKKHPNRVVIHPLSSNTGKDWSAKKYVQLARLLKKQQWEPIFIISPKEQDYWLQVAGDEFLAPIFTTMDVLASFIYESGAMIGNDSGIGHLASNLGIPTLTIIRKRDRYYRWRPGWAKGSVVMPLITFRFFNQHYWRPFLSVRRVMFAFKQLLQD